MNPTPILPSLTPLSRRAFLSKSAMTAMASPLFGGLVLSSLERGRAATVGANDRVRVALVGSGGMGRGDLATFFLNPEVDCPVVCDVDDAMLAQGVQLVEKQRGKKPDVLKDFRRVLDRSDVDAVLVATPDHWHALPTVYACQAGKDVYVEKPLATSIDEGRAMLEAAQRHNRVVQMGTQWRSGKHWAEAVELVRSGKLGKVGLVRGWAYHDWLGAIGHPPDGQPPVGVDYDMWLGPAPKRAFNPNRFHFNFRWFWDYAGGLMTDWGVHLINIMLWAMGPEHPKTVSSTGGKFVLDDNSETPDTQVTVYEFPNYTMIWEHKVGIGVGLNGRPWGISFSGSEGTLIVTDGGWEILPEPKKKGLEAKKFPGSGDARPAHVRNFLDCVKSRQTPVENLELGHHVSSVAHLGNIALRSGRKIVWDPKKEQIVGDPEANRLVGVRYRKPWKLPYAKHA
ncbi:MAG: Gfo/Idh/MocA family oxidoreductase [Verrucomicrobia bacterium]|nr:Gfo/Idh/MocA family oxidoreductase [Verrucomicrobiota bacterium]